MIRSLYVPISPSMPKEEEKKEEGEEREKKRGGEMKRKKRRRSRRGRRQRGGGRGRGGGGRRRLLFRRKKNPPRPLKIALYANNVMSTGRETSHKKRRTSVAMSLGPFSKKFIVTTKASIRVTWVPTWTLVSDVDLKVGSNMAAWLHYSKDCAYD